MLNETAPLEGSELDGIGIHEEHVDWLNIAKEAYETSTNYLDANYRKQFEKNVANFRSVHPPGSKYFTDAYKFRSRHYRPKTRSAISRAEAIFAQAMFQTSEVVNLSPADETDKDEDRISEVWEAILNHRLRQMPWFLTSVGAYQEACVYGVVISRQDWEVQEKTQFDPYTGEEQVIQTVSRPRCKLLEIENFRFDPAADWTDPINSSPYLIELMPMYVQDVLNAPASFGWEPLSKEEIIAAGQKVDWSKSSRDGDRADPKDVDHRVKEFGLVWVHRNIVRRDGEDYEFYTLGTQKMLSEPVLLESPIGRPYKCGVTNLEAHRAIPSSMVELGQNIQSEANDIVNQRRDNVRLALNKGYRVTRGKNTDLTMMKRSFPGRIVLTDDPNSIVPDEVHDVTSSAYAEEDRVNTDLDDILGGFSASSVASNRRLSETVGGMQMMNQSGNALTEYRVRTFVETWVEPVLRDLVVLIQKWEDPALVQKFAGDIPMEMMNKEMNVSVSVGFGTLDPKARVQQMGIALQTMAAIVPQAAANADAKAIARELFGVIGYRDGSKFYHELPDKPPEPQPNPEIELKTQALKLKDQEIQSKIQDTQLDRQSAAEETQYRQHVEVAKLQHEAEEAERKRQHEREMKLMEHELKVMEYSTKTGIELDKVKAMLAATGMKLAATKELARNNATADQMPTPIVEPPGRAENGRSFPE